MTLATRGHRSSRRYIDTLGTCLRTGGAAWTAALGGLDQAGLLLGSYLSEEAGARKLDLNKLWKDAALRLIEFEGLCVRGVCCDHGVLR